MTTHADMCPVCGEGRLFEREAREVVQYKGRSEGVMMAYSECDACGSDQASASQARINKRSFTAFKKRVDGLLEGRDMARLRVRMCLTQHKAAEIFGGGPVAFSKYENDDVIQSEAMDTLIRLAASVPQAMEWLIERPDRNSGYFNLGVMPDGNILPEFPLRGLLRHVGYNEWARPLVIGSVVETYVNRVGRPARTVSDLGHFVDAEDNSAVLIVNAFKRGISPHRVKPTRFYDEEDNSKHHLSQEYSEVAYERHSV